jgi:hypothetical protein
VAQDFDNYLAYAAQSGGTFARRVGHLDQSCYLDNASALRVTGGVEFVDAIIPPHFRVRAFHSAPGTQVSSRDRDFRPTRRRVFDEDNFEIQYTT